MIGIILYIDKMVINMSEKLQAHPVQMSLTIFMEKARNRANAWRTLGYIPVEELYATTAAEFKSIGVDGKINDFMRC